ncbi:MAG TPA: histidine kinase dimerization/phospho-acceptor domain-containing protein [Solirubrobacteraceae bacterium]|nr:histidine kinase dimerization/phospho-acceptor domain-containing protein [Solirubrobacteraceae bacterium]
MIPAIDDQDLRKLRHDLRSPLLVISGFAQLLATDGDVPPEQRRDYAERIDRAAQELQRLIDNAI